MGDPDLNARLFVRPAARGYRWSPSPGLQPVPRDPMIA